MTTLLLPATLLETARTFFKDCGISGHEGTGVIKTVGTPFPATLVRHAGWVTLVVADVRPGIADSEAALCRARAVGARPGWAWTSQGTRWRRPAGPSTSTGADWAEHGSGCASPRPAPGTRAWRLWSHSADLPASDGVNEGRSGEAGQGSG